MKSQNQSLNIRYITVKLWLEDFAKSIARSPDESRLLGDPRGARTKIVIIGILFLTLGCIILPTSFLHFSQLKDLKVYGPLKKSDWIVAYDDVENFDSVCDPAEVANPSCPASPEHPFWQSPLRRSDKERFDRNNSRRGKAIWYFARYTSDQLKEALKARANLFLLGVTSGDLSVWINGKYRYQLKDEFYIYNTTIPVEVSSLKEPLFVAIRIVHNTNFRFPDRFMMGKNEGFVTSAAFASFQSQEDIKYYIMPLVLLVVYFIISALFFFFWMSAKKKPEYAALSIFVLVLSLLEALSIPFIFKQLSEYHYPLRITTSLLEAFSIIWLGLTYSRTKMTFKRDILIYFSAITVTYFIAMNVVLKKDILFIYNILYSVIVPSAYFFSSLLCLSQFYNLAMNYKLRYKKRLLRLGLFSVALVIVSSNQMMFMNRLGLYETESVFLFRILSGLLILTLSYVIISEYRENELIIEKNPLTKYHRYPYLGRKISGLLLSIDLKKSEKLYRKRAELEGDQTLVSQWRVLMIQRIKDFGALYLQSKGDEIIIFFDRDEFDQVQDKALELLDNLKNDSESFRVRKLTLGKISQEISFKFRSSIVEGQIRPVFDLVDGKEYPEWEEAGNSTPFVDCGRLLSIEKTLTKSDENYLIVKESLAHQFNWISLMKIHEKEIADKSHGKAYKVASLNLDSPKHEVHESLISA